ncbi:MAG: TatD family hydrolase [Moraxellaceae bacterium]|jgi:TatD DNase family protein|nr:TatD family hydrolase [Moraxellaceae bacterium]MBP9045956.1 TatD family hydrolase [Moraxellaceae bacterium]MCC6200134.1 TatD family hydrolase [Moraxellaceae bacterium]
MFIDSHCHLDRLDLGKLGTDLDGALAAARTRGVRHFLCVGVDLETLPDVLAVAEAHEDVSASVGVHPLHLDSLEPEIEQLITLAAHPKVVAIGETGLDYHYDQENPAIQQRCFRKHIEASLRTRKPLIVHTRAAREDTIAILREEGAFAGVMHCFTEDWDMAKAALDLGFYISFSGIVSFANAVELRDVASRVPMDRLLIETDSPWLAPVPYRGKTNQPAYVVDVAKVIAELRGMTIEEVGETTSENFRRLFGAG